MGFIFPKLLCVNIRTRAIDRIFRNQHRKSSKTKLDFLKKGRLWRKTSRKPKLFKWTWGRCRCKHQQYHTSSFNPLKKQFVVRVVNLDHFHKRVRYLNTSFQKWFATWNLDREKLWIPLSYRIRVFRWIRSALNSIDSDGQSSIVETPSNSGFPKDWFGIS